jgi:hypothetical protein
MTYPAQGLEVPPAAAVQGREGLSYEDCSARRRLNSTRTG